MQPTKIRGESTNAWVSKNLHIDKLLFMCPGFKDVICDLKIISGIMSYCSTFISFTFIARVQCRGPKTG